MDGESRGLDGHGKVEKVDYGGNFFIATELARFYFSAQFALQAREKKAGNILAIKWQEFIYLKPELL